ncbi:MAG: hypothetical protein ACXAD7_19980 [Candidatus Kariarchaeaceae archaeon]|jgi:DNA-binding MarR family transcriptional regulator
MSQMDHDMDAIVNFDAFKETNLVQPLDVKSFSTFWINNLYRDEQLTQDEYLVLDFIGVNGLAKSGFVIMSFQGMKRLISLHQARLTKAINRLSKKDLLQKLPEGYALTDKGVTVFDRLFKQFDRIPIDTSNNIYSYVSEGSAQGPTLSSYQYQAIADNLVGRWFGKFRFTTKIDYSNSFEICWISTNGSISASLVVGPNNNLRLSLSAPILSMAQKELHLLIDHVSQTLETVIDAPIVFTSHAMYENRKKITSEIEDASIHYAS